MKPGRSHPGRRGGSSLPTGFGRDGAKASSGNGDESLAFGVPALCYQPERMGRHKASSSLDSKLDADDQRTKTGDFGRCGAGLSRY